MTQGGRRRLTVLAGPTAVGKGTVSADIRARYPEVWLSVSVTTRAKRPGEVDGQHYHFVDEATFDAMIAADELLEWAVVHGRHRYGTPRRAVDEALEAGRPAL
ncbi:MAG TPA: guanylate kinase, partial [Kineosporiaceae bacterium]|nr:guanylate kinase [Kineosporiaceae bacterium]